MYDHSKAIRKWPQPGCTITKRISVLLMPKDDEWAGFVAGLSLFTDDFMCNGREDIDHQERETL